MVFVEVGNKVINTIKKPLSNKVTNKQANNNRRIKEYIRIKRKEKNI
jgi:hypothetical protein